MRGLCWIVRGCCAHHRGPRRQAEPTVEMRILIPEDEPAIADTIPSTLSIDGLQPVWAATGEAALAEAARGGVTLIILDLGLPDINGFELLR
jgi:DNA-binding response OmpR family regulator